MKECEESNYKLITGDIKTDDPNGHSSGTSLKNYFDQLNLPEPWRSAVVLEIKYSWKYIFFT